MFKSRLLPPYYFAECGTMLAKKYVVNPSIKVEVLSSTAPTIPKVKGRPSRRIAITSILIALGVALSLYPGSIPVGPTRVFPFQHAINAISGIILGPINGGGVALGIGILRNFLGTGTVFAYPGGIPGALVVGFFYHYFKKRDIVAFSEPLGTAIGALLSAFIVAPAIGARALPSFAGITAQWQLFVIFFSMSSVPGAILGFVLLVALRRRGILARIQL